jgi:hypothetical protein
MTPITATERGAWLLAGLLAFVAGCLPRNPSVDLLHARLRQNEEQLAELQEALEASRTHLKQARREIDALRTELAESGRSHLTPEQAAALVQVTSIDVQPWLTGGVDKDDVPGDDAVVVYFTPKDDQGEPVKRPGDVRITLTDPAAPSGEQTLGEWTFTPEDCRHGWTRGWLGGGYQFTLPWKESPANSRLVVHVEYVTPDGRTFDDTELIKVHPSPEALARRNKTDRHTPPPDPVRDEDVAPTGGRHFANKPPPLADQSRERPRLPHSVNWTDATIPRLR